MGLYEKEIKTQMNLTCVTAVFNAIKAGKKEQLIRCVESIAKLTVAHEHLIYDGSSTDGTLELLRELEKDTPGLKIASGPDSGVYNALNKGVCEAKGEWFYVLGADDYIAHPEVMDRLLRTEGETTQVIVSPVERDGGWGFFANMKDMERVLWDVPYSHQGLIMRTSLVRGLGGFDETYRVCADWDMMLKAHEMAVKYHYTFEPFAFYATGGMSESGDGVAKHEVIEVLKKHLELTDAEIEKYRGKGYWPFRVLRRYYHHPDLAFRMSARSLRRKAIRSFLHVLLLPLLILIRPIRRKVGGTK